MCSWSLRCYWVFIFAFKQTEGDVALHIFTPRLSVQSRAKRLWSKKEKGEKNNNNNSRLLSNSLILTLSFRLLGLFVIFTQHML